MLVDYRNNNAGITVLLCVQFACSSCACVGFLPQYKEMQVRRIRDSKLTVGVRVNVFFKLCVRVCMCVCVFVFLHMWGSKPGFSLTVWVPTIFVGTKS